MRVRDNRLYPYPVLCSDIDDYVDNTFSAKTELTYDSVDAEFTIDITIHDEIINQLIEHDGIGLFFVVECSNTKFRQMYRLEGQPNRVHSVKIPLSKMNETIETTCVLVALRDIPNYGNTNLSEIYANEEINLIQYSTVGYTDSDCFILKKKINTKGEIPSIFVIIKDNNQYVSFDANGDYINIFLPEKDYAIYQDSKGVAGRLKQMMIIIPVLTSIFEAISKGNSEFESCGWYSILENALRKSGFENGFSDVRFTNDGFSFIASQMLLGSVSSDAFEEFNRLFEEANQ